MDPSSKSQFLAFLEQSLHGFNYSKMTTLIEQYLTLDTSISNEDTTIKLTIDHVFECIYNKSLSELIEIFNSKSEKYESKINQMENEISELRTTVEELRESYWRLKHPTTN
tara:strand:+ start:1494 stop:1826 length:333 start_codon:yes stop_codon:yes gene_type:complete